MILTELKRRVEQNPTIIVSSEVTVSGDNNPTEVEILHDIELPYIVQLTPSSADACIDIYAGDKLDGSFKIKFPSGTIPGTDNIVVSYSIIKHYELTFK